MASLLVLAFKELLFGIDDPLGLSGLSVYMDNVKTNLLQFLTYFPLYFV